jgi:hypothetical protein
MFDWNKVELAVDSESNTYQVGTVYQGDALVTLISEGGEKTRMLKGDVLETFYLVDINRKLISNPEDYWD